MKGTANWIRTVFGRDSIEPGYCGHLVEKSKTLEDLYHVKDDMFDLEGGKRDIRPIVFANAEEILDKVMEERDIIGYPNVIALADGGGGFFKVCLTILPEDFSWDGNEDTTDEAEVVEMMSNMESPVKKSASSRSTYAEGGTLKKGLLSGDKRVIPLAFVPDIKETHANLNLIFELTRLNDIPFKLVADYKVVLIMEGCPTATSTYTCPFCFVTLQDLADKDTQPKEERHFRDLIRDKSKYDEGLKSCKSALAVRKLAPMCNITINNCLIKEEEDPSMRILEKIILPELHSILGFVNHLFFDGVCKVIPKERAMLWIQKCCQMTKGYYGGTLQGNACRSLLSKGKVLLDPDILGDTPKEAIEPFIEALNCFNEIVTECFSTEVVTANVQDLLDSFLKAYLKTGLTITLKIHAVLNHLIPTLNLPFLKGRGLGVCTEQAGESIHHYFNEKFWLKWKLSMGHPAFSDNLKKAVVEYASKAL